MTTYIVKQGDSLSRIALRELGDESRWKELATLNQLADPDKIYIGQRITLPDATAAPSDAPAPWESTPTSPARVEIGMPVQAGLGGPPWFPLLVIGVGLVVLLGNRRG